MKIEVNNHSYELGPEEFIVGTIEFLAEFAVYGTAMAIFEPTILSNKGKIGARLLRLGCRAAALGFGCLASREFDSEYKHLTRYSERLEKRNQCVTTEENEEVESDG